MPMSRYIAAALVKCVRAFAASSVSAASLPSPRWQWAMVGRMPSSGWCCWQLIEQLLRVPEVPGVEPLGEPAIYGRKHFARLVTPTLSGQETRETDRSPQLQRLLLP